jgi:hypothetical protein
VRAPRRHRLAEVRPAARGSPIAIDHDALSPNQATPSCTIRTDSRAGPLAGAVTSNVKSCETFDATLWHRKARPSAVLFMYPPQLKLLHTTSLSGEAPSRKDSPAVHVRAPVFVTLTVTVRVSPGRSAAATLLSASTTSALRSGPPITSWR